MKIEIVAYKKIYKEQLIQVWEQAVLATHHFLKQQDFITIKEQLQQTNFLTFPVYCIFADDSMNGFIAVTNRKIEMLFITPPYAGIGLGKRLIHFALQQLDACMVDVNEQNTAAVQFYLKQGFEVFERTEKDDAGMPYPLLRMHHPTYRNAL